MGHKGIFWKKNLPNVLFYFGLLNLFIWGTLILEESVPLQSPRLQYWERWPRTVLANYCMMGTLFWGIGESLRAFAAFVLMRWLSLDCPDFTSLIFKCNHQEKTTGNQTERTSFNWLIKTWNEAQPTLSYTWNGQYRCWTAAAVCLPLPFAMDGVDTVWFSWKFFRFRQIWV